MLFISNRVAQSRYLIKEDKDFFRGLYIGIKYELTYDLFLSIKDIIYDEKTKSNIDNQNFSKYFYQDDVLNNTFMERTTMILHDEMMTKMHFNMPIDESERIKYLKKENNQIFDFFYNLVIKDKYL